MLSHRYRSKTAFVKLQPLLFRGKKNFEIRPQLPLKVHDNRLDSRSEVNSLFGGNDSTIMYRICARAFVLHRAHILFSRGRSVRKYVYMCV